MSQGEGDVLNRTRRAAGRLVAWAWPRKQPPRTMATRLRFALLAGLGYLLTVLFYQLRTGDDLSVIVTSELRGAVVSAVAGHAAPYLLFLLCLGLALGTMFLAMIATVTWEVGLLALIGSLHVLSFILSAGFGIGMMYLLYQTVSWVLALPWLAITLWGTVAIGMLSVIGALSHGLRAERARRRRVPGLPNAQRRRCLCPSNAWLRRVGPTGPGGLAPVTRFAGTYGALGDVGEGVIPSRSAQPPPDGSPPARLA
ncbi:hypothetical protein [Salipiger abyssi]|uniref:hypothetical protein n=1 Tax=Salipiger abyssi TaxID=1250539 RepID=UPI0012EC4EA0|nr:hypothetical protein [Salipiger abyssi]